MTVDLCSRQVIGNPKMITLKHTQLDVHVSDPKSIQSKQYSEHCGFQVEVFKGKRNRTDVSEHLNTLLKDKWMNYLYKISNYTENDVIENNQTIVTQLHKEK